MGNYDPEQDPLLDWEVWAMPGLAVLLSSEEPEKANLTKILVLRYRMPGVRYSYAQKVFARMLRRWIREPNSTAEDLTATETADTTTSPPEETE